MQLHLHATGKNEASYIHPPLNATYANALSFPTGVFPQVQSLQDLVMSPVSCKRSNHTNAVPQLSAFVAQVQKQGLVPKFGITAAYLDYVDTHTQTATVGTISTTRNSCSAARACISQHQCFLHGRLTRSLNVASE